MHRRNTWAVPPDFGELAATYPAFRAVCLPPPPCEPAAASAAAAAAVAVAAAAAATHETAAVEVADAPARLQLDWKHKDALPVLTACLLHRAFGIRWDCPRDRLVPPLPNRLNYLLWMDDLAASWLPRAGYQRGSATCAIDVGTGASAVFPLLGA